MFIARLCMVVAWCFIVAAVFAWFLIVIAWFLMVIAWLFIVIVYIFMLLHDLS